MGWRRLVKEVIIGVAAAGGLADLGVGVDLGVEAIEGPETVGAEGEVPIGLGLLALLLDSVDVVAIPLVPGHGILHEAED